MGDFRRDQRQSVLFAQSMILKSSRWMVGDGRCNYDSIGYLIEHLDKT
jgi:hypothetical protein